VRRAHDERLLRSSLAWSGKAPARLSAKNCRCSSTIHAGAGTEDRDHKDCTPLHHTARKRSLEVMDLLLIVGATTEGRDSKGRTPLLIASQRGSARSIQLLANRGADILTVDNSGTTALVWASWNEKILCVGQLLDLGALVDARDSDGLTALCRAAERNLEQVVCVLLDRDADADVTCGERMVTPLHLAVEARAESIVAQLRARGANLEAKDGHGRTPRDLAVENNYMGHETLFVPPHPGAASAAFLAAVKHGRVWNVLAEERGAQEQRKCSCKVT